MPHLDLFVPTDAILIGTALLAAGFGALRLVQRGPLALTLVVAGLLIAPGLLAAEPARDGGAPETAAPAIDGPAARYLKSPGQARRAVGALITLLSPHLSSAVTAGCRFDRSGQPLGCNRERTTGPLLAGFDRRLLRTRFRAGGGTEARPWHGGGAGRLAGADGRARATGRVGAALSPG